MEYVNVFAFGVALAIPLAAGGYWALRSYTRRRTVAAMKARLDEAHASDKMAEISARLAERRRQHQEIKDRIMAEQPGLRPYQADVLAQIKQAPRYVTRPADRLADSIQQAGVDLVEMEQRTRPADFTKLCIGADMIVSESETMVACEAPQGAEFVDIEQTWERWRTEQREYLRLLSHDTGSARWFELRRTPEPATKSPECAEYR